jgi:murein DD-endopeptidase MepM/ murein hydrolase activator NlpD
MQRIIHIFLIVFFLGFPFSRVYAEDPTPTTPVSGPIYIVQSGDNLTSIANRFGITTDELIAANQIIDPNQLKIGDELIIPGLEGVSGYLVTETVGFGNSLKQFSIKNQIPVTKLIQLNHITSPAELYAGVNLIIPQQDEVASPSDHYILQNGQSELEFAILAGVNPWSIIKTNSLAGSWDLIQGQSLFLPVGTKKPSNGLINSPLDNVFISPLPMVQGKTISITVAPGTTATLSGNLTDHELHFMSDGDTKYTALQGIHAMQQPGIYPLTITVHLADGSSLSYEQMVIIQDGYYPKDPVINVKDEFIDPTITKPEMDWLTQQVQPVTTEKYWSGMWTSPSPYDYNECLNSRYGNRRSYNGGPFENFHSGVDFCGGDGVKIFAPAAGKVIFAGSLTVRGNATIIDHGWGVYTGIWHQSKIEVAVGDMVEQGQEIGLVGGTGRVTGAHLHWEVWAGGVQVNPLDWLQKTFPVVPPE